MNMNHTIAIVTGGNSGLGRSCVELLKKSGMKVASLDNHQSTDSMADLTLACDVRIEADVQAALDTIIDALGTPNVCVNCAGIAPAKKMVGRHGVMPLDDFKHVLDVNLIGTFNVMRLVADAMIKQPLSNEQTERGVIINTASVAAFEGQIGQLAYSASKGGVVAMTLPAARELAAHAIRVNTIAPGLFATPMLLNMPEDVQTSLAATVTFPKRLGKPAEYASLVKHIIDNEIINGEVIRLDGALRMQAR